MIQLDWMVRESDGRPFALDDAPTKWIGNAFGVYVIWNAMTGRVRRLGSGRIADRLIAHRSDEKIIGNPRLPLFVHWAETGARSARSIEAYLAAEYDPEVGEYPSEVPTAVNLPDGPRRSPVGALGRVFRDLAVRQGAAPSFGRRVKNL
jgi:hypothetical protein